jgi:hypothetical protein
MVEVVVAGRLHRVAHDGEQQGFGTVLAWTELSQGDSAPETVCMMLTRRARIVKFVHVGM